MNLTKVRARKAQFESELVTYLADPVKYQKEITVTRGRLLRILYKEHKLEPDPVIKGTIHNEIKNHLEEHKKQLNSRIASKDVSKSMFIQIPEELGLKFKKVKTSIKNIKYATTTKEKISEGFKTVGNTLSIGGTILKVPVVGALRLGSTVSPVVSKIVVFPLHIPGLIGHVARGIVKPDSKYTGQWVDKCGDGLNNFIKGMLSRTEAGIRKL